jgi:hypothetical protein
MSVSSASTFTVADLERLLLQTEPAALLVAPRILRRVIKKDRGLANPGLQVPHRKSYVIERERLLHIAEREELGVAAGRDLPPTLFLFPRPDEQHVAGKGREATLLKYWRLLFHARVHAGLQAHPLTEAEIRGRIRRIGVTEFDEATAVLRQEYFLLPPADARTVYEEFAAVYLELRYFDPHLLPVYFPTCACFETIDAALAPDLDAAALFEATRLPGAPAPVAAAPAPMDDEGERGRVSTPSAAAGVVTRPRSPDVPRAYRRLLERADRAEAQGNMVRAAVFRMRAARAAPPGQREATRSAARRQIEQFSARLQQVLGFTDEAAVDWRRALLALLEPAARGIWPSESRMLYDLQKVCIDQERPVYAVDLVEWLVSWGRRPVKRLLPFHGPVLMVKHLRAALHRLTTIRIPEPIRRRLIALLIESTQQCEQRLRERLRPAVRETLDRVGLTPRNIAEQVARDKVVEELIDRVVGHGFLGMGDLRDAIARNRLKLPDLTDDEGGPARSASKGGFVPCLRCGLARVVRGTRAFFLGDLLIRANRQLANDLDRVYHRGEIYLRWLQRFSAVAFGTQIGRLITLYAILPFGCSLALLKMWDHVRELIEGGPPEGSEEAAEAAKHINPYAFTLLGLFFLALIHVGPFRRVLLFLCVKLWDILRGLFWDLPVWFVQQTWVRRILQSDPFLFFYQLVFKPLPWAASCALALAYLGVDLRVALGVGAAVFIAVAALLNSRLGLYIEEVTTDSVVRTWQLVRTDIVPGLVRWVIYLFRRLQEEVERLIYTVDEWLRFRPGDNRLSLVLKPALGLLWFCLTYVFRVIFNLFVEPTFNPIKHFPVVTVTAKLIVPIYKELFLLFSTPLEPVLGKTLGGTVAGGAIFLLPGLAGFLVWEFKENWRLYRANQSPTLRPEIVGHHGETMLLLMRPGLHSGTLPKLYARLRHGRGRSPRKQYEALHHLRERLRQFIERNLLAVLAGSKSWGNSTPLTPGDLKIGTNRIRLELCGPGESIHIDFEEHAGWLTGGLTCLTAWRETWLAGLTVEQTCVFVDALAGFYKLAGVDVVREQISSLLPAGTAYDLRAEGLVVWPTPESEIVYDLRAGPQVAPISRDLALPVALPPLPVDALLYSTTPIHWLDWVQTWQLDHDGKGHIPLLPARVRLLPDGE